MNFMELEIRPLRRKDYSKVISFAMRGMHFERYFDSKLLLHMYGHSFWYGELSHATQITAAYYGDELAGVLLADMNGEPKAFHSVWWNLYLAVIDFLADRLDKDGINSYYSANKKMLREYAKNHQLDGEICFLAANPDLKIKGVGTFLLNELKRREPGKHVYVYTDSNCTYQFYEHRGFEKVGDEMIGMDLPDKGDVPLECFLYSRVLE